jgi:ribonucleoside-diphosphate reductase alpha chain
MNAVVHDLEHLMTFRREETGEEICKKVRARDVFRKLCENNWNYAEPGILYWDRITEHNLLCFDEEFKYAGVNPCAEEPLPAGGSCLLGSLNLSAFVKEGTLANDFDHVEFRHAVRVAVRALNEVLDEGLELHPLQEQRESVRDWRQIGLGIFGLADMLVKMGIQYGSDEAVELCNKIGRLMASEALKESAALAGVYGSYPKFKHAQVTTSPFYILHSNHDIDELVNEFGLRNSQLLTIAPTGSLSTMLGVSGGIEPIFDTHYTRKTESLHGKDEYYTVYTPIVEKYMKEHDIKDVKDLPDFFITAKQLDEFKRVNMQAVWQKHIDASISSTVNLPESATIEEVEALYIYAWEMGLKGLTIFRENCARLAILTSGDKKEEEPEDELEEQVQPQFDHIIPKSREELGERLSGTTYVKQIACGKLYITINRDENDNLVEVFIDPGKSGGCTANAECIGRYASACMRAGMSVDAIVDVTKGVKCSACMQAKGMKKPIDGLSCGDVIAKTIQEEYKRYHCDGCPNAKKCQPKPVNEKMVNLLGAINSKKSKCPECGAPINNSGGCVICPSCGYSKCD